MLITAVYRKKDALERHILVQSRVCLLRAARSRKAEELRQDKEVVMHGPLSIGLGLLLDLPHGVGLFLFKPLHDLLLEPLLLGLQARAVVSVDLFVLGELLLQLSELSLEGGLLEDLSLLISVDDAFGDQLVERLAGVLAEEGVRPGGIDLRILLVPSG